MSKIVTKNSKNNIETGWIVAFVAMLIIAVVASILMGVFYSKSAGYRNALENRYQSNYAQLINNVNDIEVDLSKLVATTSFDSQKALLQKIYTNSVLASENLGSLPISSASVSNINLLINRIGGYAYSLLENETVVEGDVLDNIANLHESVEIVKYDLNKALQDVDVDSLYISDSTYAQEGSSFTAGLLSSAESYSSIPTLIYDGPFSESVLNKEPKVVEGLVSEVQARKSIDALEKYFGDYSVEYVGNTNGKLATYNYSLSKDDSKLFVQVLQNGGKLISVNSYGDYVGEYIDVSEARLRAEEMCYEIGYVDMSMVWSQVVDDIVYINLAYVEDGVIYYGDLIKVKVDLNGGEIVGFDATNYIYNHHERTGYANSISIAEAQLHLSSSLEVVSRCYCVVPNEYVGESNAFEYECRWSGYTYYVYIDANTGKELKVMRVVKTNNGDLLQ